MVAVLTHRLGAKNGRDGAVTFPGLPTSLHGELVIEPTVDEDCQANLVTLHGQPYGCWLDDTTPELDHWLGLAVAKYGPLNQTVFVCIPPGRPHLRHKPSPPVVNVLEVYHYGMGVPPAAWGKPPACEAYCIQWAWPGTVGKKPPTDAQRDRLLTLVRVHKPRFIFCL